MAASFRGNKVFVSVSVPLELCPVEIFLAEESALGVDSTCFGLAGASGSLSVSSQSRGMAALSGPEDAGSHTSRLRERSRRRAVVSGGRWVVRWWSMDRYGPEPRRSRTVPGV